MKKFLTLLATAAFVASSAVVANAAKFTSTSTTALGSSAATFSPSTNVGVDAIATDTAWAAAAKHEAGGTIMYGLLSTSTNMQTKTGMAADATVTNQTSATSLTGF